MVEGAFRPSLALTRSAFLVLHRPRRSAARLARRTGLDMLPARPRAGP